MYRLVYSLVSTHWRNYIMSSDENFFCRWIDLEMECFLMVTILSSQQITSLMYGASSSFIRFLYVCSSLQRDVQSVYQRTQFTFTFIGICEAFNVMNILSAVALRMENS